MDKPHRIQRLAERLKEYQMMPPLHYPLLTIDQNEANIIVELIEFYNSVSDICDGYTRKNRIINKFEQGIY